MMELRPNLDNDTDWTVIFNIFVAKGLAPFRIDNECKFVKLDPNELSQWKNKKHPKNLHYDVVWKKWDKNEAGV